MSNQEKLIPWADFVEEKRRIPRDSEPTEIACPDCGRRIYRRTNIIFASYPPTQQYFCGCGWTGYA